MSSALSLASAIGSLVAYSKAMDLLGRLNNLEQKIAELEAKIAGLRGGETAIVFKEDGTAIAYDVLQHTKVMEGDDDTVIQGIVDYIHSNYGGGKIKLLPGTYNAVIDFTGKSKIMIEGAGEATLIDMSVFNRADLSSRGRPARIDIKNTRDIIIKSLRVKGVYDYDAIGITYAADNIVIDSVTIEWSGRKGILLYTSTSTDYVKNVIINNVRVYDTEETGIDGSGPGNMSNIILNNIIVKNSGMNGNYDPPTAYPYNVAFTTINPGPVVLNNITAEGAWEGCVAVEGVMGMVVANNITARNCGANPDFWYGSGFLASGNLFTVAKNITVQNARFGIRLYGASNPTMHSPKTNLFVMGAQVIDVSYGAITIQGMTTNVADSYNGRFNVFISGVDIHDSNYAAIYMDLQASNKVINNMVLDNINIRNVLSQSAGWGNGHWIFLRNHPDPTYSQLSKLILRNIILFNDGGIDIVPPIRINNYQDDTVYITGVYALGFTNKLLQIDNMNSIAYARDNLGFTTENGGVAEFTGDGSTTTFTISHGLDVEPSIVLVTPLTPAADADRDITWDGTNITITFSTAPPNGATLRFSWYAAAFNPVTSGGGYS